MLNQTLKQVLDHLLPTTRSNSFGKALVHGSNPVPYPTRTYNQPTRPEPVLPTGNDDSSALGEQLNRGRASHDAAILAAAKRSALIRYAIEIEARIAAGDNDPDLPAEALAARAAALIEEAA